MVKTFVSNVRRGFLGRLRASSRAKDTGGINLWDCWDAALWLMVVDKMDDAYTSWSVDLNPILLRTLE